tara:strand:- start:720 stop:1592 length:873 start_codon:yes stop_codon:yes gene_type:complete
MDKIKGTGVALVTPFNRNKSVDYKSLEKLLNHVINGGVDYLVVMGTTGESISLSKDEKKEIIDFCKKINNGRLPIVLGIGGNNTNQVLFDIKSINLDGIDALLSVSPFYNKPTQDGIYHHYKLIAEASPIPVILYNVPSRTSSNINSETTLRLATDFENIVAIKEASGDLDQIMSIIKNKSANFLVLSGDDALTLPMIYMGAEGVISVIGQSHPKDFTDMVSNAISGNNNLANQLHYKLHDLYKPIYAEGNPVGIKACLELLNICNSDVRLPLIKASANVKNELKQILKL